MRTELGIGGTKGSIKASLISPLAVVLHVGPWRQALVVKPEPCSCRLEALGQLHH